MVGPHADVVLVSDILKGWGGDVDGVRTTTTASATESGNNYNHSNSRGRGSPPFRDRGHNREESSGEVGSVGGVRSVYRSNGRSTSNRSVIGGVQGFGGGGGGKTSIVTALERTMSRSTYGGRGGGQSGDKVKDWAQPQREKKRSEELFGTLMGQDGRGGGGPGAWGHAGSGSAGGEGRGGKAEVDLGFLHRSLQQPEDAGAYLELLLPAYKALPEDCVQKAR